MASAKGQGQALLRPALGSSVGTMDYPEDVTFYMEPDLRESAAAGKHNFIGKVASVLQNAGIRVTYRDFGAPHRGGYSLSHMKEPPDPQGLVFRRVYHYPFWQIERSAARWQWDVACANFDGEDIDRAEADRFYTFWQKRLFGDLPQRTSRNGFIYIPLQGRITRHRSFQHCSPIRMVEACLAADERPIVAALHPKEQYSADEHAALYELEAAHPRLTVRQGGMDALLRTCDCVVTQNSSVAFNGYFFRKPALLFARVDFHHIAVKADLADLARSFALLDAKCPDYAGYLHWFWQKKCINAGRPDAEMRIAARFRRFGWLE
ncbi:hypothetical protein [uncultured Sulfitobacter sp.]|uniref:hypothetical protein n=1 Tax=uncultured Sulfitobacter sp. TaxID=191468 RepID=UPI00260C2D09|nr:hypothetical protein [uncultured Sulfitobacter sp.]